MRQSWLLAPTPGFRTVLWLGSGPGRSEAETGNYFEAPRSWLAEPRGAQLTAFAGHIARSLDDRQADLDTAWELARGFDAACPRAGGLVALVAMAFVAGLMGRGPGGHWMGGIRDSADDARAGRALHRVLRLVAESDPEVVAERWLLESRQTWNGDILAEFATLLDHAPTDGEAIEGARRVVARLLERRAAAEAREPLEGARPSDP
jgi:hypothetical protein